MGLLAPKRQTEQPMRGANDQVVEDRESACVAKRNMALKPAEAATVLREVGRDPRSPGRGRRPPPCTWPDGATKFPPAEAAAVRRDVVGQRAPAPPNEPAAVRRTQGRKARFKFPRGGRHIQPCR